MTLALYVPAATAIHRLHPVTKLGGLVALVVAAFVVDRPALLLPLLAGVTALLLAGRGGPNLRRFWPALLLVFAFTLLVWTFFYGPTVAASAAGFRYGLSMAIRLDTFLVTGLAFLSTTKVEELAYALSRVGVPDLVGFTLTLSFRLVPVFFESAITILAAQRCRGLDVAHGGPLLRLRRFVPVIVPVFVGALRRADRMAMALELRGFNSGRPRTRWRRPEPALRDAVAAIAAVGVAASYLALWWRGDAALPRLP